jgi:hypothetical protein
MERDVAIPGKKAKCLTYDPITMEVFNVPQTRNAVPVSGNRLYYLLACSEDEVSWDTGTAGMFTKIFCWVYDRSKPKNRLVASLMRQTGEMCWPDQTPTLKIVSGNGSKRIF